MAAVADVRRRVIMISGAIDATDHDVSVCINLPEPGRWQVIKSETNLTDQIWVAMQVTTDEDSHFVSDEDTMIVSRQFAKTFVTPDQRVYEADKDVKVRLVPGASGKRMEFAPAQDGGSPVPYWTIVQFVFTIGTPETRPSVSQPSGRNRGAPPRRLGLSR